jgi:uncharacterized protein YjgD (DUF1641 family)
MEADLVELHQKVDRLSGQLAYLAGQAQIAEQQRRDRGELMRDLTPIADQAYHMAVEQLEEVQEYVDLADLLRLAKRLLRNGRNLDRLLSQLESAVDLAETAGPLADEAFGRAVHLLTDLEHKGYFAAARGGARILENIVTSFSEDDVRRLGDNVVLILNTIKEMTQPEIMHFVHDTLLIAEAEFQTPVDASLTGLLRQLRDPAVRRGLALTMRVLHVVGAQAGSKGDETPPPQPTAG